MNTQTLINQTHAHKLSLNQTLTLLVMRDDGEDIAPSAIAKRLHMSSAGMTIIGNELLRRQLITRRHDFNDRRKVKFTLTPMGRNVADCILQ